MFIIKIRILNNEIKQIYNNIVVLLTKMLLLYYDKLGII